MAAQFATVMNCNVLPGELKHKDFKQLADHAAPQNLMGYLFAKDVLKQSMRLGLAGSWDHSHPDLMEALEFLESRCPSLLKSFLPTSEHTIQDAEDETQPQRSHMVDLVEDDQHVAVSLTLHNFVLGRDNGYRLRKRINLSQLGMRHEFIRDLALAYRYEYGLERVMDFGSTSPKWYERIAYTDPYVFLIGHEVFDNVDTDSGVLTKDTVLDLPICTKLTARLQVVGLPGIINELCYFIPNPYMGLWQSDLDEDNEYQEHILRCDWGVDYL
ncbi:MAG: hypothetical protein Q9208_008763 [Pyrenodesmia sp. 3 TL-2023]